MEPGAVQIAGWAGLKAALDGHVRRAPTRHDGVRVSGSLGDWGACSAYGPCRHLFMVGAFISHH